MIRTRESSLHKVFMWFLLIVCFCFFFGLCLLVFSFALYFWWMGSHPWFLFTGFFFFTLISDIEYNSTLDFCWLHQSSLTWDSSFRDQKGKELRFWAFCCQNHLSTISEMKMECLYISRIFWHIGSCSLNLGLTWTGVLLQLEPFFLIIKNCNSYFTKWWWLSEFWVELYIT
jgi:hypothetical protein